MVLDRVILVIIVLVCVLKWLMLRIRGGRGKPQSKPRRFNALLMGTGFTSSNKALIKGNELNCRFFAKSKFLLK